MLTILLKDLQKPYLYSLARIYYDMHRRAWVPIPRIPNRREEMLKEWVAELIDEQDADALRDIGATIDNALEELGDAEQDDESEPAPSFSDQDRSIVQAAILLLNKAVQAGLPTPAQALSLGKAIYALERLPMPTDGVTASIDVTGPRKWFGEHEIWHWWTVNVSPSEVQITSQGHFYRERSGGDRFIIMHWTYTQGKEPRLDDYLDDNRIVDDAQRFEPEVEGLVLSAGGYSVTVYDDDNTCLSADEEGEAEDDIAGRTSQ
jgi:hypothetical protein